MHLTIRSLPRGRWLVVTRLIQGCRVVDTQWVVDGTGAVELGVTFGVMLPQPAAGHPNARRRRAGVCKGNSGVRQLRR